MSFETNELEEAGSTVEYVESDRCVDLPGGSSTQGTTVQIYDCNGSAAQQWLSVNGALRVYKNEHVSEQAPWHDRFRPERRLQHLQ